jgi:predicted nucleic acid-binding protein
MDGWATCPACVSGFVRVLSNPAYAPSVETPAAVVERLRAFCESPGHVFWSDGPSLRDRTAFRLENSLRGHRQITDVCLLAVAVRNGGRLATFDRSIPYKAVVGARAESLVVLGG